MFLFIHILFVISAPNIKLRDENGKLDDWLMMSETQNNQGFFTQHSLSKCQLFT